MFQRFFFIDYQNIDSGDSFKFTLENNDRIKYFILSVYDQDGNTITDMTDYIIHIQFTVCESVKGIGYTNYSSRPMEKTTSMNKQVADHGNKAHYNKVGK